MIIKNAEVTTLVVNDSLNDFSCYYENHPYRSRSYAAQATWFSHSLTLMAVMAGA
jgi:hypothetical protein